MLNLGQITKLNYLISSAWGGFFLNFRDKYLNIGI
jgi:hypothetical protein